MFTRSNIYFLLMILATSVATAVLMRGIIDVGVSMHIPSWDKARLAYLIPLLPAGVAFFAAPDYKAVAGGAAFGLLAGLARVVYPLLLDSNQSTAAWREYYFLHAHILDVGLISFIFVILAIGSGFGIGWLQDFFEDMRLRRLKRKRH